MLHVTVWLLTLAWRKCKFFCYTRCFIIISIYQHGSLQYFSSQDNLLVMPIFVSAFRFQIDPSSPYAKPIKSLNIPSMSSKKGQLSKDIQQVQADCVTSADFRAPEERLDDQNLTEDQMAWRYSSKEWKYIYMYSITFVTMVHVLGVRGVQNSVRSCKIWGKREKSPQYFWQVPPTPTPVNNLLNW